MIPSHFHSCFSEFERRMMMMKSEVFGGGSGKGRSRNWKDEMRNNDIRGNKHQIRKMPHEIMKFPYLNFSS